MKIVSDAEVTLLGSPLSESATNYVLSFDRLTHYLRIINAAGTTAGFITPLIVAHYTQERSTIDEWSSIFLIGAIAYIAPAILFTLFGSGKIQHWNDLRKDDEVESEEPSTISIIVIEGLINAKWIPTRLMVAVMLFFACFFSYMLRNAMSINILAMVKPTTPNENGTIPVLPNFGPERLDWSGYQQSILLGCFFWGYAITPLPSGVLSDKFGGRRLVGYSFVICCVLEALTPVAAASFWLSVAVRFLIGFFSGVLYPALHKLVSKWAPPEEKGKFVSALVGGAIGTVATWSIAGYLVESVGWDYAFYVPALLSACFTIIWFLTTFDDPATHPRITKKEKEYIENSLIGITHVKRWPPLLHLVKSLPLWALFFLHYGNLWGLYFLMTAAPKYMNEVLKFNLSQSGVLASLPYLARFFSGIIFGSIGDVIRRREWFKVTTIRKSFCLFSHIIPGLFLIALPYVNDRPYVCVTFVTLSLGFNGAGTMTNLQNSQDLAPNYAATLYGIINAAGTTAGFITPLIVAHYTQERSTIDEWSSIFLIGAIAYIAPAILFILFGSGKIQHWNDLRKDDEVESEEPSTICKN